MFNFTIPINIHYQLPLGKILLIYWTVGFIIETVTTLFYYIPRTIKQVKTKQLVVSSNLWPIIIFRSFTRYLIAILYDWPKRLILV